MEIELIGKQHEVVCDWYEGKLMMREFTVGGYTNWRLPRVEELVRLSFIENDCALSSYWSSDEYDGSAFQYSFATGVLARRVKDGIACCRAVRDVE